MTLQELLKNRNSDGRIVLDPYVDSTPKEVELGGKKEKDWWILDDARILVKFYSKNTYEDYAELLAEKTYNYFKIPAAHCDLISLNGRNGILSVDVRKADDFIISGKVLLENYHSVQFINNGYRDLEQITPYYNTLVDIQRAMACYGFDSRKISDLMNELDRVFAVSCFIIDADKHWRNWGIIGNKLSKDFSICPQYDSGAICRFALTRTKLEKHLRNVKRTNSSKFKKTIVSEHIFSTDFDKNTLLRYDRDHNDVAGMQSFFVGLHTAPKRFSSVLIEFLNFDPNIVITEVEKQIGTTLPETCKNWYSSICQINQMIARDYINFQEQIL